MRMEIISVFIFVLGYLAIAFEHPLKINKTATALLTGVLVWVVFALVKGEGELGELSHHLGSTSEILFFLLGAMTLVELIDAHQGFRFVNQLIQTKNSAKLLWIVGIVTFFISAALDNLTTAIVMVTLLRKLISDTQTRKYFVGVVVIAANAGGAWSPIGDVTTTMLWIGHKVSTAPLIINTFIPSVLSIGFPLLVARFIPAFKGEIQLTEKPVITNGKREFIIGVLLFLSVPLLKSLLHIPPYMGMLLALCLFALYAEIKTKRNFKLTEVESNLTPQSPTMKSLQKVELPTILFFLGILLTVAALESIGFIFNLGQSVQNAGISTPLFMGILGLASAVIDNVPLVAGAMGMFSYPMDHNTWHLLAYTAGTGGSILIIGSAAGVVAMGLEKISFSWYLKRIAPLAFLGYLMGYLYMYLMV